MEYRGEIKILDNTHLADHQTGNIPFFKKAKYCCFFSTMLICYLAVLLNIDKIDNINKNVTAEHLTVLILSVCNFNLIDFEKPEN